MFKCTSMTLGCWSWTKCSGPEVPVKPTKTKAPTEGRLQAATLCKDVTSLPDTPMEAEDRENQDPKKACAPSSLFSISSPSSQKDVPAKLHRLAQKPSPGATWTRADSLHLGGARRADVQSRPAPTPRLGVGVGGEGLEEGGDGRRPGPAHHRPRRGKKEADSQAGVTKTLLKTQNGRTKDYGTRNVDS